MLKVLKVTIPAVLLAASAVASAATTATTTTTVASTPASIKIGVLDMQQIMQDSPQVAVLNKGLQGQFQPRQQKIAAAQKNLQDEIDKYNKNGPTMSADDRSKLQDQIISDRAAYQALVQAYQQDLASAQAQDMQKFMSSLQTAVNGVAKQGNYTLVVQRAAVPYADPSLDITKQVLAALPSK